MIAGMRCDNATTKFTPTAKKRKGGQAAFSTSQCQCIPSLSRPSAVVNSVDGQLEAALAERRRRASGFHHRAVE